jgi:hypothetical protein
LSRAKSDAVHFFDASIIGKVLEGQVPVSTAHDSKEGESARRMMMGLRTWVWKKKMVHLFFHDFTNLAMGPVVVVFVRDRFERSVTWL